MDHLEGIELHGHARRVKASQNSSRVNDSESGHQHGDRPVETNRPAERLFVDYVNEDERKRETQRKPGDIRKQSEQARFQKNELAHLSGGGAKKPQQPKLAAAVDHESEQCSSNSHDGDEHRDSFEGIRYRKGAVENANGLGAQVAIGEDKDAMTRGSSQNFRSNGFERSAGRDVDREIGWGWVRQIA